jgi:hypothetical protein
MVDWIAARSLTMSAPSSPDFTFQIFSLAGFSAGGQKTTSLYNWVKVRVWYENRVIFSPPDFRKLFMEGE